MNHDDERDYAEERANAELGRDDHPVIATMRLAVGRAIAEAYRALATADGTGYSYTDRVDMIGEALQDLVENADYATGQV